MRCLLILVSILFCFSCENEKVKPLSNPDLAGEELADYESWNTEIIFSELGQLQAVLFSDHLKKFEKENVTFLEGVEIDFYSETGEKTTVLTSKRGRVDDITKNMFAIDSVVVVSDSGVVLKTEELTWQNKLRKITSDKFVTITSPTETIEGYGFESDQSLSNYKIFKITYSATVTNPVQ